MVLEHVWVGQPKPGKAIEQHPEGNLAFHPGQVAAQAHVAREAKAEFWATIPRSAVGAIRQPSP